MNEYQVPEMNLLGDATGLIQGSKVGKGESQDPLHEIAATGATED